MPFYVQCGWATSSINLKFGPPPKVLKFPKYNEYPPRIHLYVHIWSTKQSGRRSNFTYTK